MQIICNHCGNQLSFPDYQNLVTCNHCATHLQIEERETTYSVEVIDEQLFDSTFQKHEIINEYTSINDYIITELLTLENKYTGIIEKYYFPSFLQEKFRPHLSRGLFKFIISLTYFSFIPLYVFLTFSVIGFILLIYFLYLAYAGLREIYCWYHFSNFEEYYNTEKAALIEDIESIEFKNLAWKTDFLSNYKKRLELINKFHYIKFSNRKILNIEHPSLSQGIRMLLLSICLFICFFIFDEFFLVRLLIVVFGLLLFTIGLQKIIFNKKYELNIEDIEFERKKLVNILRRTSEK